MRYNSFGYLISEGFKSVFKQKKMTSASIIIMCATMFMFGVFYLLGENVNYVMRQVESQQGMRVIIKDDASESEIDDLKNKIQQIENVSTVKFYSKEDALASMKSILGEHQDLIVGYDEDNPFPASYFVTLTDLSKNKEVQDKILKLDPVEEISTDNDTIANLSRVAKSIQNITLVLLTLLIIISIFIISYTIKLTVYARRREISIMKYVGATNSFIRGPFIVEGIIIGIISAFITIGIVAITYEATLSKILESSVMKSLSISLFGFTDLFIKVLIVYLILGTGIGVLGSTISMRKYLKV
ncbi:MAG: permease-like cell division protein FtsX [Clostridia bacterium]|nr:permease-like cell division protein FtsX [Clostridia bacterium]